MSWFDSEIYEPYSWILGILAVLVAFIGLDLLEPQSLLVPYNAGIVLGVLLGFVLHELMHRGIARRYGLSAEFVAYTPGLLVTLVSALLPARIIAPGYVRVWGSSSREGYVFSVAGGPLANIAIALAGALAGGLVGGSAASILAGVVEVNLWIALFNLLPAPPLDGYKLVSLDARVWAALVALLALAWLLW